MSEAFDHLPTNADLAESLRKRIETLEAINTDLYEACKAALLFHATEWNSELAAEWKRITGHEHATTKALCDHIRKVLAKVEGAT